MPESDKAADKANAKKSKKTDEVVEKPAEVLDDEQVDTTEEPAVEIEESEAPAEVVADAPASVKAPAEGGKLKCYVRAYWRRKKWTLPVTLLLLIGLIAAIPATRYPVFALWMQRDVQLSVVDDSTKKPIASAQVTLDGRSATTDNQGNAKIKAKVGKRHVSVSKKYYASGDADVFVGIKGDVKSQVTIKATGRQVPLKVVNKISGKPIENALIKAAETEVKTDKDGKAILVLPAGKTTLPVVVSNGGFNENKGTLTVTESEVPANTFTLTPSGKLYFLSKKSGTIDVVKTNLDGSERETVVGGTGKEDESGTVLLASRDWHYLALLSRRDSDKAKLYLIDTSNDKMTTMDEGNATFNLVGWSDSTFVYRVSRNGVLTWQPGATAIKSYDANKGKLTQLDQTDAAGNSIYNYVGQTFYGFYLLGSKLVYAVNWSSNGCCNLLNGKNNLVRSVDVNGSNKKDVKSFPTSKYYSVDLILYEPQGIYIHPYQNNSADQSEFYEYEEGVVKLVSSKLDDVYSKTYPTYLLSPSGKKLFWSESRDGVATFFVGNQDAEDQKQIAAVQDNQVYGWYGDDYLLMSKKGSELYIMPVDGGAPLKVTDYHKPSYSYAGYGGGYGGL